MPPSSKNEFIYNKVMNCPRCTLSQLIKNTYEGVEIDACPDCQGVWLDTNELTDIVRTKEKKFTKQIVVTAVNSAKKGVPDHEIKTKLNCPVCSSEMTAINYAIQSGIIIDRCDKEHGLWFDATELEKIQAYREFWQEHVRTNQSVLAELVDRVPETKNDHSHGILFSVAEFFSKFL